MGAKSKNFDHSLATKYGYGAEADRIQELYRPASEDEAARVVPDDLVRDISLIGPADFRQGARSRLPRGRCHRTVRDTVRRRVGRTGQADRTTARTDLTAPNNTHAQLTGRHPIDRRQQPAITREHTPAPSQHFNLASDLYLTRCGGKS